jgi:hypothetical protein
MVSSPTRDNNILDQILTNMADLYSPAKHIPPLGRSDHQCLWLYPKIANKPPPISKIVRRHNPGSKQTSNRIVALQNWDNVIMATDVDDKVEIFNGTVLYLRYTLDYPRIKIQIKVRRKAFSQN